MNKQRKILRLSASTVALIATSAFFAGDGFAQTAQSPEQVTVTGTRIVNGAAAPTPVTSVDAQSLDTQSPISIPDALSRLPQFTATVGARTPIQANGRGFGVPNPNFNLYNLGAVRTLVLLDGNRIPGTFYDTTVNVDMLPQMLVSRVDVVTGGASAVYGSDAVAGVVNYILDHNFTGFKGTAQGGISTYGDAKSFRFGAAVGFPLFDRGHFEASAEYFNGDSVPDSSNRRYGLSSCALVGNGSAAVPLTMACGLRQSNTSPYGLFVNGPAKGMQFSPDGKSIVAFNPGTPTTSSNTSVGGDGGVLSHETLLPADHTFQGYARFDYNFNDKLSAYIEGRYATDYTIGATQGYTNTNGQYPLWIYNDNAFLTAGEQSTLFPGGSTTPVDIARFDNDLMRKLTLRQYTNTNAITFGFKGSTFGDFTWDAHFTHGQNHVTLDTFNNVNTGRFYAALDAVVDPASGQTVCRTDLTAPSAYPGCAPLNMFGQGNQSQAAQKYIFGTTYWVAANSMDDAAANFTGTLFDGWAGPIKGAWGLEYRSQGLNVTTSTPDATFHPQNLRLAPFGTYNSGNGGTALTNPFGSYPSSDLAWFKEVQAPGQGSESISETDVELDAPLLKGLPFAELVSLNAAYRYAQYVASGNSVSHSHFSANTWKIGLEWSVNDDVRFRLSESRDFRAPTLWDLYQQQIISSSGINDPLTKQIGSVNTVAGGNPALRPEVSYNYTAGVVLTPGWIPNLTASVDYFHIKIGNAIAGVGGLDTTVYNLCQATGAPQYCGLVVRPGAYNDPSPANFPTLVLNVASNVALREVEGFNTEIDYTNDLSSWTSMRGDVNFRFFWTHQDLYRTGNLPGTPISNGAGTTGAPRDKMNITLGYTLDNFSVNVVEQYIDAVNWQSSGPPSTQNVYATTGVTGGKIPAYSLTNLSLSYDFSADDVPVTGFANITNLWNTSGPLTGGWTGSPGMLYPVPNYADTVGRFFTVGVRVKM